MKFDSLYIACNKDRMIHIGSLGTAEYCCICIPGRACVEGFVDLLAAMRHNLNLTSLPLCVDF